MFKLRHTRRYGNHWIHFHSDKLLLITYVAVLCMWPQAYGQMPENDLCSKYTTCKSCTTNINDETIGICSWSLKIQQCRFRSTISSEMKLVIDEPQFCPNYTVVKSWNQPKTILTYSIETTLNDAQNHFVTFLEENSIQCFVEGTEFKALIINNSIVCRIKYDEIRPINTNLEAINKDVFDFHVTVNGSQIMFENDNDYFLTGYDKDCNSSKDDDCVTCLWKDNQYRYYNRWCSANNTCTGLWHKSVKELVIHANGVQVNHNVELMCPEVQIQLIGPKSGVQGGVTTIEFSVNNHWILIENQTMTVTVAGWECTKRQTKDDGSTITCTVAAPTPNATGQNHEGPVQVTYTSWQNDTYRVTSKQLFRFVDPELKNVSTDCIPVEGGYQITIMGRNLDAGNLVQVTVAEKKCETLKQEQNQIVCTTSPTDVLTGGRVKVEFEYSPGKYVGSEMIVYSNSAELDANQSFGSIATGGTMVPVRGRHFACAEEAALKVDRGGIYVGSGCDVINDTYLVCQSPFNTVPLGSNITILDVQVLLKFPDGRGFIPVTAPDSSRHFVSYPDPVFVDFEVQNGSVVINGRNLNQSYLSEDLTVWFTNPIDQCNVTETTLHRVLCVPSSPSLVLADIFDLVVKIGMRFESKITRKAHISALCKSPAPSASPTHRPCCEDDGLSVSTGFQWVLAIISVPLFIAVMFVLWFYFGHKQWYNVNTLSDSFDLQPIIQYEPNMSQS